MDLRTRIAHLLPPLFVLSIIAVVESVYMGLHLLPLLQIGRPDHLINQANLETGRWHTAISQSVLLMLLTCYFRAVVTHPGSVPRTDAWLCARVSQQLREFKTTGKRRHCKWCKQYKPDRTHHCRVCETCVLKMDHHCPWIMNCVGFRNHKFFFLLVSYVVIDTWFIIFTMAPTVNQSVAEEMSTSNRFCLVLALTLTIFMGILMTVFWSFHAWLAANGMTTIEFCEKTAAQNAAMSPYPRAGANYNLGRYRNFVSVLGSNPFLWFLPVSPPGGDGVAWEVSDSRVSSVSSGTSSTELLQESRDPEWTSKNLA